MCLPGTSWGWQGLDWVTLPWQRLASASRSSTQRRVRCCRPSSSQSPQSVHSPQSDEEWTEIIQVWDWNNTRAQEQLVYTCEKKNIDYIVLSAIAFGWVRKVFMLLNVTCSKRWCFGICFCVLMFSFNFLWYRCSIYYIFKRKPPNKKRHLTRMSFLM